MNNLQIFNNAQFGEIRTIDENGTVLFCGSDIAKALGYSNTKDALARHCKEDGVVFHDLIDNMGREQHAKFINEGNVYRLITHSKLPAAEQFESWVFDEVLPTIRRNGAYMTDDTLEYALTSPDFLIQLATKLKEEKAKRIELEAQVEQDKPINIRINQKIEQQRQFRELATNISPSSGGGHSSGVSDKVGMAVAKIATLEQEINAEIDELIRVKAEIEHTISAVADERLRLILIARYINCKTFEYIACEMHYSYKQICRLHGKALLRVQNVLECPIASVV